MMIGELIEWLRRCPDDLSLRVSVHKSSRSVEFTLTRIDSLQRHTVSHHESFAALDQAAFSIVESLLPDLLDRIKAER